MCRLGFRFRFIEGSPERASFHYESSRGRRFGGLEGPFRVLGLWVYGQGLSCCSVVQVTALVVLELRGKVLQSAWRPLAN